MNFAVFMLNPFYPKSLYSLHFILPAILQTLFFFCFSILANKNLILKFYICVIPVNISSGWDPLHAYGSPRRLRGAVQRGFVYVRNRFFEMNIDVFVLSVFLPFREELWHAERSLLGNSVVRAHRRRVLPRHLRRTVQVEQRCRRRSAIRLHAHVRLPLLQRTLIALLHLVPQQAYLQPRAKTLERQHPVWRSDLSQALDHPLGQSFGAVVLPSVFDVREIYVPCSFVVHDVEERPHRRDELFGEAVQGGWLHRWRHCVDTVNITNVLHLRWAHSFSAPLVAPGCCNLVGPRLVWWITGCPESRSCVRGQVRPLEKGEML